MKKFYKTAEAGTAPGGFTVRLDGKAVKTPLKKPLLVPCEALAAAMADEWRRQGDIIRPETMPVTQLVNTWLDHAEDDVRAEMHKVIADYAGSDLVCYLATYPQGLVARQEAAWNGLLAWLAAEHNIKLSTVFGIQYHKQDDATLQALENMVQKMDGAEFTALQAVTRAVGSVVIGLAVVYGRLTAAEAFQAACVDELYQMEQWGADDLAQKRLDMIHAELTAVETFLGLVKNEPA